MQSFRRRPCRYWTGEMGSCRNGEACNFAHDVGVGVTGATALAESRPRPPGLGVGRGAGAGRGGGFLSPAPRGPGAERICRFFDAGGRASRRCLRRRRRRRRCRKLRGGSFPRKAWRWRWFASFRGRDFTRACTAVDVGPGPGAVEDPDSRGSFLDALFDRRGQKLQGILNFPGGAPPQLADRVLRILASAAVQEADLQYKVNEAYAYVCDPSVSFLNGAIPRLLRSDPRGVTLQDALFVMEQCLQRVPDSCTRLPLADLRAAIDQQVQRFAARLVLELRSRARALDERRSAAERMMGRSRAGRLAPLRGHTADDDDAIAQAENDYRAERLLPSAEDLASGRADPFLRENLVGSIWPSARRYLDTHFRLLREDFCASLRTAAGTIRSAAEGRERAGPPRSLADPEVSVRKYINVRPIKPLVGRDGWMNVQISFGLEPGDEVEWAESDALTYGQLLCLTPVRPGSLPFERVVFATVARRELSDLQSSTYGRIDINFIDRANLHAFSWEDTYLMIEAPCFFGATEPVLKALQAIDPDSLPFASVLLEGDGADDIPEYLRRAGPLDMSCLYTKAGEPLRRLEGVEGPLVGRWPHLAAIRHMLTHKVAVVQGPPGTGKSFVGVKLVQILNSVLEKQRLDSTRGPGPILVICYTNHALDEFASDLLPHIPELVRVGGRSRTDDLRLKERMLSALQSASRTVRTNVERIDWAVSMERLEAIAERVAHLAETLRGRRAIANAADAGWQISHSHAQMLLHILSESQREDLARIPAMPAEYEQIRPTSLVQACYIWARGTEEEAVRAAHNELERRREEALNARQRHAPVALQNPFDALAVPADEPGGEFEDGAEELEADDDTGSSTSSAEIEAQRESERNARVLSLYDEYHRHANRADWQVVDAGTSTSTGPGVDVGSSRSTRTAYDSGPADTGSGTGGSRALDLSNSNDAVQPLLAPVVDVRVATAAAADGEQLTRTANDPGPAGSRALDLSSSNADVDVDADSRDDHEATPLAIAAAAVDVATAADGELEGPRSENDRPRELDDHLARVDDERHMDGEQLRIPHRRAAAAPSASAEFVRSEYIDEMLYEQEDAVDNIRLALAGEEHIESLWDMPLESRRRIVASLLLTQAEDRLADAMDEYEAVASRIQQMQSDQKLRVLRSCPLVAMTSTAAAMHRDLIVRLRPSVLVIEEAAELLEAQVLSCISPSVQHVIMIGDHEQLRPSVNCFELEKNYKFHISMFERLLQLRIPKATLRRQARMRPEIAEISRRFYPELEDHPRVLRHEPVRGTAASLFLIDHSSLEAAQSPNARRGADAKSAKVNEHEAQMAVRLADYLIKQGYQATEITLLTPYLAQFRRIRHLAQQMDLGDVRVVTVDDYQGDENTIVILSLVRSNEMKRVGFIGIRNRIIVSLSRARKGLFVFGNFGFLAEQSPIWSGIVEAARDGDFEAEAGGRASIGRQLELVCQKHPEQKRLVSSPWDFAAVRHGGCTLPCGEQLACGHVCDELCHPDSHDGRRCRKTCKESYEECDHQCARPCHHGRPCPPCGMLVEKPLGGCGHTMLLECAKNPAIAFCTSKCEKVHLGCNHQCTESCGKRPCGPCRVSVLKTFACGIPAHAKEAPCSSDAACAAKCDATLGCGHPCPGTCGSCHGNAEHLACTQGCKKALLCGHNCKGRCSEACTTAYQEPCENGCVHRQRCRNKCGELCLPCREPCRWKCSHHSCSKLCYELCDRPVCNKRCQKRLSCRHKCRGVCGEPCPPCPTCEPGHTDSITLMTIGEMERGDLIYRLECGHVFALDALDEYMFRRDTATSDGHVSVRLKDCPTCRKPVRRALRYGNVIKPLLVHIENVKRKIAQVALQRARAEVVEAMRVEVSASFAGGRWFTCPNGHPYFIGECGGAMQVSTCIDCGARVGGSGHRILEDNAFAGSMDGSERPAWSTMLGRGRV
eukprot:tig00000114_g6046.t1